MEMSVKIKLSSGKEIKLTKEEYEELKDSFGEVREVEVERWYPYYPYYPYEPYVHIPSNWCDGGSICLDGDGDIHIDNSTITTTNIKSSNGITYTTASIGDDYIEVDLSNRPLPEVVHIYDNNACMGCYTKDNDKEAIIKMDALGQVDKAMRERYGVQPRNTTGNNWD